jgi:hypothetical protein
MQGLTHKTNLAEPVKVPGWFAAQFAELVLRYPSQAGHLSAALTLAYWRSVAIYSDSVIARALARLPKESANPDFLPSAELLRRLAEAEHKVGDRPKQDLSRPALPEPELTLPPDNPFYDKLEAYKRGEIPCREQAKREVFDIVARIDPDSGKEAA